MQRDPLPSGQATSLASATPGEDVILAPGRNCWRVAETSRAAVLIDGAEYFARLHSAMTMAERSLLIVGWDFDGSIILLPAKDGSGLLLGPFLRALVEDRPALEVRILVWSVAVLHAPGAPLPLLLGADWQEHPRISVRLDSQHPIYASHHQKLVCIDDCLAFSGGIDLTVRRWDTREHAPRNALRKSPDGSFLAPVHDLQMVVDGEAARLVARLARRRWEVATREALPECRSSRTTWPRDLDPDFINTRVAVSRTMPAWNDTPPVREVEALTADAISAARSAIYIETQYFASRLVRRLLLEFLDRRDGPEIVMLTTRHSRGLLERIFMGNNRDRLLRTLNRADRFGRFKAYSPFVKDEGGETDILVHAKLLIVDDRFIRVGSANLNNRSMGLDTECDLSLEARSAEERQSIRRIRGSLLAEHLGAREERIESMLQRTGSLIETIEAAEGSGRGLRPFRIDDNGPCRSVPGTRLFDPPRPFEPLWFLRRRGKTMSSPGAISHVPGSDQRADLESEKQRAADQQGDQVVEKPKG